jgi:hypothetical protein
MAVYLDRPVGSEIAEIPSQRHPGKVQISKKGLDNLREK